MQIDTGAVVDNRYELVRLLGRGSMGEVWVAHHRTLGEKLALKLLTQVPQGSDEVEDARQAAARFRFEAQVAARLSRKTRHIVRVTDHGEEDGLAYLVMELLDGRTLETALTNSPTLPVGSVVKLVAQIARALTQAHVDGVLHRDLKPANVFLTTDEDGALLAKLLDFGIARAIHAHRVPKSFATHKGVVFGTPAYMSPEQARASSKLDHRCDLWALATIAYEALTGDLPVAGNDAEELLRNLCAGRIIPVRSRNPRLPDAMGRFFDRAFAERIENRYSSAAELAADFEAAAGSNAFGTAAMPPTPAYGRVVPPSMRSRTMESGAWTSTSDPQGRLKKSLAFAGAAAATLAVVAVVGGLWHAFGHAPPAAIDGQTAQTQTQTQTSGANGAKGATVAAVPTFDPTNVSHVVAPANGPQPNAPNALNAQAQANGAQPSVPLGALAPQAASPQGTPPSIENPGVITPPPAYGVPPIAPTGAQGQSGQSGTSGTSGTSVQTGPTARRPAGAPGAGAGVAPQPAPARVYPVPPAGGAGGAPSVASSPPSPAPAPPPAPDPDKSSVL